MNRESRYDAQAGGALASHNKRADVWGPNEPLFCPRLPKITNGEILKKDSAGDFPHLIKRTVSTVQEREKGRGESQVGASPEKTCQRRLEAEFGEFLNAGTAGTCNLHHC